MKDDADSGRFQLSDQPTGWIGVTGFGLPYPVQVRVGVADDGRFVCTGLRTAVSDADDAQREITARSLREIPLTRILVALAQQYAQEVAALRSDARSADGAHYRYLWPEEDRAEARRLWGLLIGALDAPYEQPRVRPGPRGHPEAHFREVADAYRRALVEHPRGTFVALARQYHASEATVRRWVQRAQDKGYLGASTPGKAGRRPREES